LGRWYAHQLPNYPQGREENDHIDKMTTGWHFR
jgi:hypothetical protein